jgi:regulator of cell morphogenesis and NO signaling
MKLLTTDMKMADVVQSNYLLMPVISRFGIPFGFGEMTIREICRKRKIDADFFCAIINAFSHEDYFPAKRLKAFNVLMILEYLERTHTYYTRVQIPLIERLLQDLTKKLTSDKKKLKLIKKFYLDYKQELLAHLSREEQVTFPYIKKVYRLFHSPQPVEREKRKLTQYSMHVYEEEHSDVDEKLNDLKSILIKYVRGETVQDVYQKIIAELFRFEKDIRDHTRIEDKILLPMVAEMEDRLFSPREHSRRSDGSAVPGTHSVPPMPATRLGSGAARANLETFRIPSDLPRLQLKKLDELTSREVEVLQLVACGLLNKEIADTLSISLHTVISHRRKITKKLEIRTVAGLTIYALMNGLISSRHIS